MRADEPGNAVYLMECQAGAGGLRQNCTVKYLNYYNPLNGLKNIILFVCIFISRRTWNKFGGQWWSVHLHCWGLDRFKNFHFLNFQKFLVIESCFSQWSQPAATRRWRSWSGWQKMDGRVQNAPLTSNSPLRKRWAGCTSIWSYGITLVGHTLSSIQMLYLQEIMSHQLWNSNVKNYPVNQAN